MKRVTGDTTFFEQSGGGVTFSGGEPLLQGDFLLALLRACKALDLDTTVDTCGHAPTATLEQIRPFTDRFLDDLKLMDSERHRRHTGVPNTLILHNLRVLAGHNHPIILRVPIIPNINDDADNIHQIGALASTLPAVERVDILAYHHIGTDKYARLGRQSPMPPTGVPSDEQMAAIQHMLEQYGLTVTIGG
jgi:pyruvate formate lyase activating enzyme